MKNYIIVLTCFVCISSCLFAANNTSTIYRIKPMSEEIYSPITPNQQISKPSLPDRQNFLTMDFTGLTALPTGWTVDAQPAHWSVQQTNYAGGTLPELRFDWSTQFTGISRLISPNVNTSGITAINLEFLHYLWHYTTPYMVGVATRSNGGTWHDVWTLSPTENVAPEVKVFGISNSDVGSSSFQICFYFSGNSYNINDWYIDNIKLYMWSHDVKVNSCNTNNFYTGGSSYIPSAVIKNVGLNSENFPIACEIKKFDTIVYSQTINVSLDPNLTIQATFPSFIIASANEMYSVSFTTNLTGDQNTSNNAMTKYFNTYATERQKVMLEIGTGTWCQYCPGAAMGADELVSNGKDVAVIEYHNGDTFTNTASDARNTYYNITGYPTATFDGTTKLVGGNHTLSMYSSYLPIYESLKPIKSPFYIALTGSLSGTALHVNAFINRYGRISSDQLVLHFAVTETEIPFVWQGQTQLNFVERAMVPNASGTTLNIASVASQTISLDTTLSSSWTIANLNLVAFIQNPTTKEIYQGFVMPLSNLILSYEAYAPQNLTAIQNQEVVNLAWAAPSITTGLSAYLIYRDRNLIYTKTDISSSVYTDIAIPGNHAYMVKALYGPTVSDPSNTVDLTVIDPNTVASPENMSITLVGASIFIHWDAVPDAMGYKVYYASSPTTPSQYWLLRAEPTINSYTDTVPWEYRFYKVTATK
jgi:hypothetical protein